MDDTIAAIATAYGEGGIGIVRISGEDALAILTRIFVPANSEPIVNRRLTYGKIVDENGKIVDEVLAVFMKAPFTYTKEDVVEINCHGSIVALRKTLSLILKYGARLAENGEFTKRAFLNGRIDLSQAEAVIDLVRAKTEMTFDVAMSQLGGAMTDQIVEMRKQLLDILVNIAVNIDYPEEDIEEIVYEELQNSLMQIGDKIGALLDTADAGRIIREGLTIAIIGKPNVGKSSLMNALLRETRAIVTEIPGTTRDTIEELVSIGGVPVRLIDTAGIRETEDTIERLGIEKSKKSFNEADLIIFVLDRSNNLSEEDMEIIKYLNGRNVIVLLNKSDVRNVLSQEDIRGLLPEAEIVNAAVINMMGIEEIEKIITEMVFSGEVKQDSSMMVTNARHVALLENAASLLRDSIKMIERKEALDFAEADINSCYENLGLIIGESVSTEIIDEVFERFCLGK